MGWRLAHVDQPTHGDLPWLTALAAAAARSSGRTAPTLHDDEGHGLAVVYDHRGFHVEPIDLFSDLPYWAAGVQRLLDTAADPSPTSEVP